MKKTFTFLLIFLIAVSNIQAQNVGIGISNPTRAKLEVHGSSPFTSAIFGGETTGISMQSDWPAIGYNEYLASQYLYLADGYGAIQYLNPGNGSMSFVMLPYGPKDGTPLQLFTSMIISNTGNVGIKTNPGNATLYAPKAGNSDGSAVFSGTSYSSYFDYGLNEDTYIRGGLFNSKVIINDLPSGKIIIGGGNSKVGINNGNPTYALEVRNVNGKGLLLVEPNNAFNNWELRVSRSVLEFDFGSDLNFLYNGQYKSFIRAANGEHLNYSDRRLKTNISIIPSLLTKFMQLQPVEYQMKYHNANNEKTMGFIAQDVRQLFPELVSIITDTSSYQGIKDLVGINYHGFSVLTIKAIQEQQELIKKMQQQNATLVRRIEHAEAIVNARK